MAQAWYLQIGWGIVGGMIIVSLVLSVVEWVTPYRQRGNGVWVLLQVVLFVVWWSFVDDAVQVFVAEHVWAIAAVAVLGLISATVAVARFVKRFGHHASKPARSNKGWG